MWLQSHSPSCQMVESDSGEYDSNETYSSIPGETVSHSEISTTSNTGLCSQPNMPTVSNEKQSQHSSKVRAEKYSDLDEITQSYSFQGHDQSGNQLNITSNTQSFLVKGRASEMTATTVQQLSPSQPLM